VRVIANMPEDVSLSDDAQYILVRTHGARSMAELRQTLTTIVQLHESRGIRRVLIDARARPSGPTSAEAYDGGKLLAEMTRGQVRFAIVVTRTLESYRLFENAAVNRGARVDYFTDIDAARQWLVEHD
jgi:hypothetical protein